MPFSSKRPGGGGTKACDFGKKDVAPSTVNAVKDIKDRIRPFEDLGFHLTEAQVFWYPMDCKTMVDNVRGRDSMTQDSSAAASSQFVDQGSILEQAQPPDGLFGSPQWRWCHMGLILLSEGPPPPERTGTTSHLFIIMDLNQACVRTAHLLVETSLMQQKLKQLVVEHCNRREVYSAGINKRVLASWDLGTLLENVSMFCKCGYNPMSFNCQHFTYELFRRLTGQNLSTCLGSRWRNTRLLVQGDSNPSTLLDSHGLSLAMNDSSLIELRLVDMSELLFCFIPLFSDTSSMGCEYRYHLHIHVIWFQYCRDTVQWYWSPYRFNEVEQSDRWISVKTRKVSQGRFQGQEIQQTCAGIVQYLAKRNPFPVAACHFECPICFEDSNHQENILQG